MKNKFRFCFKKIDEKLKLSTTNAGSIVMTIVSFIAYLITVDDTVWFKESTNLTIIIASLFTLIFLLLFWKIVFEEYKN